MKYTHVLFDLDGTLLPMDQDAFVKAYFGLLARRMAPRGYDPRELVNAIWQGTAAMVENDGSRTNEQVFWECFQQRFGPRVLEDMPLFEEFYHTDFELAQESCGYTDRAAATVGLCRALGFQTALATNPIFPAVATRARIRWAGLKAEDFALITTYENSRSCKPNLLYYRQITEKLGVSPRACLMVGNDVQEDMVARELGMQVFLLTDCLINKQSADISQFPHGGFPELQRFLEQCAR